MPKSTGETPNELIAQMFIEGKDCGITLFQFALRDGQETVLVAAFRDPAGADKLLAAVHLLCEYWFAQGLGSADHFQDLLAWELSGLDPHH